MTGVTEFEGEWRMVSGVMNGETMDEPLVKIMRRVTRGNRTTVSAGPQIVLQMDFTTDSSKSPKTIDYVNTAGGIDGENRYGIYEFDADLLKVCVAAPGQERPEGFRSIPGDGKLLTVWTRV